MNKKIFGLFLVVAALLSAASFQSCKDNDSDLYNEVLIKDTQHYNELKNRIDAIESSLGNVDCEALKSDVDALKAEVAALKAKLDEFPVDKLNDVVARIEALEAQNTEILAAVEALQFNYEELLARVEAIEESLCREDCAALKAELEALKAKVAAANLDRVNELLNRVNTLEQQMKLKGVTVQSVYTPAFGSFNSAVGLNSNILLGYCGKITTGDPDFGNGYKGGLKKGDVFTTNLGTIYLTVDPLNVDAAGYKARLVNSLGESAGVEMDALKKADDHDIKLGYTRAEDHNHLYQTTAKLNIADDVKHLSLDVQGYKDALMDLINYKDGVNLGNIASLIYNTVHSDLSANALEVSYNGETVISKYEIAAALVKPLSLATVETLNNIDGGVAADKLAAGTNKLINKVQTLLSQRFGSEIISFNVQKITLVPNGGEGIKFIIPEGTIKIENPLFGTSGQSATIDNPDDIEITIPMDKITPLFGGAQTSIDNLVDQVNSYIAKINNAWTKVTTPGAGSELIDKAIEVLVNKTLPIAQRATHLVNPTLFVVDGDNIKRLSTIEAAPTVIENAEVDLFITSYSLELAVPFYQKYISAKDVKIEAEEGRADLNGKVFPGTTMRAKMSVTASGVKEITYQVADYNGDIRQVKYYVTK